MRPHYLPTTLKRTCSVRSSFADGYVTKLFTSSVRRVISASARRAISASAGSGGIHAESSGAGSAGVEIFDGGDGGSVLRLILGTIPIGVGFVTRRAATRANVFPQNGAGDFPFGILQIVRRPHLTWWWWELGAEDE